MKLSKMKHLIYTLFFVIALGLVTTSCEPKGDHPGYVYMPDMDYSAAYETFSSTKNDETDFTDSSSARELVAGTIPYGSLAEDPTSRSNENIRRSSLYNNYYDDPYASNGQYAFIEGANREHSKDLINPLPYSEEVLELGEQVYVINCSMCHGEKGEGNGWIYNPDGPYNAKPANYYNVFYEMESENVSLGNHITDGIAFHSITYGKGKMGAHNWLTPEERWAVIHYIRDLGEALIPADAAFHEKTRVQLDEEMESMSVEAHEDAVNKSHEGDGHEAVEHEDDHDAEEAEHDEEHDHAMN